MLRVNNYQSIDTPEYNLCICEFDCENCYHYFIECPLYDNIRRNFNSKNLRQNRFKYHFIWKYRTNNGSKQGYVFREVQVFLKESNIFG